MKTSRLPFSSTCYGLIAAGYASSFAILWLRIGPWEAARQTAIPGLILVTWLWIASRMMGEAPETNLPIKRPAAELLIGAASLILIAVGLVMGADNVRWLVMAGFALPALALIALRYDRTAAGLRGASRRAWLTLLLIIVSNIAIGLIAGALLPESESTGPAGIDLAERIAGIDTFLLTFAQVVFFAAIPEELTLRVFLQPRLTTYISPGWAILIQALLFSALHLPQQILQLGNPPPLALAYTLLVPMNGLIGGVLWRKTRSLPLLVVLHIFAYPRFGL